MALQQYLISIKINMHKVDVLLERKKTKQKNPHKDT